MPASQKTDISSFLIRFIHNQPSAGDSTSDYRGRIRHIQTGDEIVFTRWVEAKNFMQRFFPISDLDTELEEDG